MTKLRRLMTTALAVTALSGLANADVIISYTTTLPSTSTDLTNTNLQLTGWNPGGTGSFNTIASDSTVPAGLTGLTLTNFGVTMNSLNAANTVYTLKSYDIYVSSTLVGTFSATAGPGGSTGSVRVNSYNAVSLGSTMAALSSNSDPTNDLFYDGNQGNPGAGPNAVSASISANLAPNTGTGTQNINKTAKSDLGSYVVGLNDPATSAYTPINTGLGTVTTTANNPLNFYFSTLTTVNSSLSGGSVTTSKATSISELVSVVYDFTTSTTASSTTPEPTTMALFGSALVGLGLLRKRVRRS
jgi:hypothetical protein